MKKRLILGIISVALILILFAGCTEKEPLADLWEDALYTDNAEFGTGDKTVKLVVKAKEKSVEFIINTDKETLGDALIDHKLIEGEKGPYGLYVKKVNGITADYDIDKSYWSLTKNGEYMTTGVDGAEIKNGEKYELTYIKE